MMVWRGVGMFGLGLSFHLSAGVAPASAQEMELRGAAAVIEQWANSGTDNGQPGASDALDPLRNDLEAYRQAWPAMSPDDAAAGWLDLYDRWASSPLRSNDMYGRRGFGWDDNGAPEFITLFDVVEVIPGPEVWPTLKQQIDARGEADQERAELALRLLVSYLAGDESAFQKEAKAAVKAAEKVDPYLGMTLLELIAPLTDIQRGDEGVDIFRQSIQQAKTDPDSFYAFEVPDLVTLYGEEEARELLEEIVTLRVESIEIEVGDVTRQLATRVALEKVDALTVPRWGLVWAVDEDSVALYEKLEAKFVQDAPAPAPQPDDDPGLVDMLKQVTGLGGPAAYRFDPYGGGESWEQTQARVIYLLGLIVLDRIDDATAVVEQHYTSEEREVDLPWGMMETLQRAGVVQPLFDFAERMIDAGQGDALWAVYIELGAQLEQSDRVLAKVEAALADVDGQQKRSLLNHLVSARLAADEVELGIDALREWIALGVEQEGALSTVELSGYPRIARIGLLMERDDWVEEGLTKTSEALRKPPHPEMHDRWQRSSASQTVAEVLMKTGRWGEAEEVLAHEVERAVRTFELEKRQGGYADVDKMTESMTELVAFYGEAERWGDVMVLLQQSPYWGVDDLSKVSGRNASISDTPVVVYVVRALRAQGQNGEAWRIVNAALDQRPGDDALSALLVEFDPQAALIRLDELFARDQFEERPLIWKAKLQLDAGDIESAAETIAQAIKIDPSDGEQGPGDRMRAYAIYAEILRAQGDTETAAVMEGAVRAIRMSEDADEFDQAGLLSRAVSMYQESLTHFADAYCIQLRLAIQLSNLGRYDEAAEHYERAYELMPSSFGRVESHCFGCEGAFRGDRAQTIADRVFDKLVATQPFTPQVHYLRGYLRSAQDRDQEALEDYREAVRLDPDYLNAWGKIQGLANRMQIDREERDRVALEIFRLDPLGRHSSADLEGVRDLAAAWNVIDAAQPLRVETPDTLWALPESAAWAAENVDSDQHSWRYDFGEDRPLPTPGGFLAGHGITQAAAAVLGRGY
ncbi:MAG: tetratricopeptide repeat protein [Planctomycetota bacterium]